MPESSAKLGRSRTYRRVAVFAATALLAALQGCSSIPDAANPVEWYKGARDWVAGSEAEAQKAAVEKAPEVPGESRPFPKVSSVPEAPGRSTEEERRKAAQSLIADRERARYTDEVIRRQTASIAPTPPPAEAPPSADAPLPVEERETESPTASSTPPADAEPPRSTAANPPPAPAPAPPSHPSAGPAPRMRTESVEPPVHPAPPLPPVQAESMRPPARPTPPPFPALGTSRSPAPPPSPVLGSARPPAPPPLPAPPIDPIPASTPPSQLVFGPPPSDIALVQNERNGRTGSAPRSGISIESLLPPADRVRNAIPEAPPPIAEAPDPLSLDPASQVAVVTFEQGSSRLTGTARRIIREVVEMQRQRGGRLHVIGHSSSWTRDMNPVRHNMVNFGLSLDRANAVARELLQHGLTANSLTIGAMSDARPLFFEVMPSGEAGNRRVEIFLDGG